jgi:ribose transport system permease protein
MSTTQQAAPATTGRRERGALRSLEPLSPARISGIYVWGALILLFALWVPETFLTGTTFKNIAAGEAVTALITLGLLFPLAAGTFDLSIGFTVGLSGIIAAKLLNSGSSPTVAVLVALGVALAVGVLNGVVVVGIGVDSFIATLGTGSVIQAVTLAISNNEQIIGLPPSFGAIGNNEILGLPLPVFYVIIFAFVAWYALEHTPFGRYLYAIGSGREAARLAGIKTDRFRFATLIISALAAGAAGVVVTARLGSGSPDIGPEYLLPAFAAAFLGATQLKPGRINVWGALIAVYLLATGVTGLQLAGASFWITYLFNGLALIIAVSLGVLQGRLFISRQRRRRRQAAASAARAAAAPSDDGPQPPEPAS